MKQVLILEDDEHLALSLKRDFEDHGYRPHWAPSLKDIPAKPFDFAVLDLRLGGEFGLEALHLLKECAPHCRSVVLSSYGSIATAVEAVKRGAVDYLAKPASFVAIEAALQGRHRHDPNEGRAPSLAQVEHEYIDYMLTKNEGNISQTARDLGIHRQSLQRKLKKYT